MIVFDFNVFLIHELLHMLSHICDKTLLVECPFLSKVPAHVHLAGGLLFRGLSLELYNQCEMLLEPGKTRPDFKLIWEVLRKNLNKKACYDVMISTPISISKVSPSWPS